MVRASLMFLFVLTSMGAANAVEPNFPGDFIPNGKERPAVESEFYLPLAPAPSLTETVPSFPWRKRFEEVADWVDVAQRRATSWGLLPRTGR